jgi:hypothetical protein
VGTSEPVVLDHGREGGTAAATRRGRLLQRLVSQPVAVPQSFAERAHQDLSRHLEVGVGDWYDVSPICRRDGFDTTIS